MHYTPISTTPFKVQVTYSEKLISLGSCFADQIGKKLKQHRFDTSCNPFGIVYNPFTLSNHIWNTIHDIQPIASGYVENDGICYHHDYHSSIHGGSQQELFDKINHIQENVKTQLAKADYLMLTLGSAMVYRHVQKGSIVGNCHKVPQSQFSQEMLSAREITTRLSSTITALLDINPKLNIVLTVSPVRYLKDGAINNSRSKAQLITAAMLLEERHDQVNYWPAYEIFMDQLRGYRWVDLDLVHPNVAAVEVIWEAFIQSVMSEDTISTLNKVKKLNSQLSHRPFNPNSDSHIKFVKSLQSQIQEFKSIYPHIQISEDEIIV